MPDAGGKAATMARPVHFEIQADDPERAKKFYGDVLGWKFQQYGEMPYFLATTGDDSEPGINGALTTRDPGMPPITNTVGVESVDASVERAVAAGGTVVAPKMPIPNMGWVAYLKDTEGNVFGM